jgi:predicted tellurium resistance membrane protein TerC
VELLVDPQAWASFLMLAVLEVVLGIDNILFLAILVDRLPVAQRGRARILGLTFAMFTRIALLLSVTWLASLRRPLITVADQPLTGRGLVLLGGGVFLIVQSIREIREHLAARPGTARRRPRGGFWGVIAQIGLIDIAFSFDTVFTAIGLAKRIEIMVAAIVASVLVMMGVSGAVSAFIERQPTLKMLALAFLIPVGGQLIAEAIGLEIPQGYLYAALVFAAGVEWLNARLRRRHRT